ncbi:hypothetical protein GCM10020255_107310 [Rhodococcus baikonurensis]
MLQTIEFDPQSSRVQELSPLARVSQVTTPTLILHGGSDVRCPVNQAEQWFGGLRLTGTPTELVVFPDASHAFVLTGRPSHRLGYSTRLVDWIERHLSPTPALTTVDPDYWQYRLDTLSAKYGVPGASLGILTTTRSGFDRTVVTSGVVSTRTGVAATPDTLFQMGSISKVWTATLIMQLVEEGLLDLDAPVRNILPDFAVDDAVATATVTTRQLLTHTSGIDGDVFIDGGRGDDCVERYVAALKSTVQLFAPGTDWSYCNTGFVIAGRIIEVLRGKSWDAVLRERIIEPLGLAKTTTLPEETALHRAAVGHVGGGDNLAQTPQFLILARWARPASSTAQPKIYSCSRRIRCARIRFCFSVPRIWRCSRSAARSVTCRLQTSWEPRGYCTIGTEWWRMATTAELSDSSPS